jgi:hypothetical protein
MKIEGFSDGDRVWLAAVYVTDGVLGEPASAGVFTREATVLMADAGIVREDGRQDARVIGFGETVHGSRQAAISWVAAEIRRSADNLYRQADELSEPRVVTV